MSKHNKYDVEHKTSVGGQALLEGIMMQGPKGAYMSVRLPDGTIDTEKLVFNRLKNKFKPAGYPIIRGIVTFIESMIFGYKCMSKSAEKAGLDSDEPTEDMSKLDKWLTEHFGPKMVAVIMTISAVLGFAFALLGEPLSWWDMAGVALVAVGILVINRPGGRTASPRSGNGTPARP